MHCANKEMSTSTMAAFAIAGTVYAYLIWKTGKDDAAKEARVSGLKIASGDVGGEAGFGMAPDKAKELYDGWGDGYTASVESWGYDMPMQIATRLAAIAIPAFHPNTPLHLLDAGAGDGLTGMELRKAGFASGHAKITGADLSPKMLSVAAARGCYDTVQEIDLSVRLPFGSSTFEVLSCVGVLTYLAPACGVLEEFVRVTKSGGFVCYNLRTDHEASWSTVQQALVEGGKWRLIQKSDPMAYLPSNPDYGQKVQTVIYVFKVL